MEIKLVKLLEERFDMPHYEALEFVANMAAIGLKSELEILLWELENADLSSDSND